MSLALPQKMHAFSGNPFCNKLACCPIFATGFAKMKGSSLVEAYLFLANLFFQKDVGGHHYMLTRTRRHAGQP